jgi:hypothetical protein
MHSSKWCNPIERQTVLSGFVMQVADRSCVTLTRTKPVYQIPDFRMVKIGFDGQLTDSQEAELEQKELGSTLWATRSGERSFWVTKILQRLNCEYILAASSTFCILTHLYHHLCSYLFFS